MGFSKVKIKCDMCNKIHIGKESIDFDGKHFCSTECYTKYLDTLDRKKIIDELAK